MQDVVTREPRESFGHTYAEPLAGLRVSWGAVAAGTVAMLAVSLILWALALALVSLGMHADPTSLRNSIVVLWICAMASTIIGAGVGGVLAGYLTGNPRPIIGMAHGFLAWGLALVLSFGFQMFVLRGLVNAATSVMLDSATVTESTTAPTGAGASPRMEPPRRARPSTGDTGMPTLQPAPPGLTTPDTTRDARVAIDYLVGAGWSWFGTWFLAGVLAIAGATIGVRRLRSGEEFGGGILRDKRRREPPLTPAPTT